MVNVTDVDQELPQTSENGDRLDLIFAGQQALIEKYHPIEERNGLLQTDQCPVAIDDRHGQARLKDFAWRITEELAEFTEAEQGSEHSHEELGDVLHFLVEFLILSGIQPEDLMVTDDENQPLLARCKLIHSFQTNLMNHAYSGSRYRSCYKVVQSLGLAMNCLKQKPWKQSHMATDIKKYRGHVQDAWDNFIKLCIEEAIDSQRLFQLYFLKNKVNEFRIGSNY